MLFTIIIPAYNAEPYLDKCLKSVFNQTCDDYEVIVVDDGSVDRTWEILCSYSEKNSRLKTIQKENGGIGSAVEMALEVAEGDYIVFIDSDDYIHSDMLQILKTTILDEACDIVQYGLVMVDAEGKVLRKEIPDSEKLVGMEMIMNVHFDKYPSPSLASRCFRKSLFENAVIPKQNIGVDEALIVQLMASSQSMVSINKGLYYVYIRGGSVSRNTCTEKRIEEYLTIYKFMNMYATEHIPSYRDEILIKYLKLLIEILSDIAGQEGTVKEHCMEKVRQELKTTYHSVKSVERYRSEKTYFRCGVRLCLIHPNLYNIVKKIMK